MNTSKPSAEELAGAHFQKSSYSGAGGNECVEVAQVRTWACVRDSKQANGPTLTVQASSFTTMMDALKDGGL
ncbi:DUF397 domain-containing protein [Streptomyces sp. NPDC059193]|uniref:DUF397 domain-containing protein n=1 Tax=Streptomyces sp. NPDC059193 TaxID=3346763 RepID=UPI0036BEBA4D